MLRLEFKELSMRTLLITLLALGLGIAIGVIATAPGPGKQVASKNDMDQPDVLGRVENVYLEDAKMQMKSRIDTGAGVASLDAEIIEIKKDDKGKEKVTFKVINSDGSAKTLTRSVIGWQNIKKRGTKDYFKRPVVKMDFCIGGKRVEARVNLAKREHFLYPLLVGRNVLKAGDFHIDPAKKFLGEAKCPK